MAVVAYKINKGRFKAGSEAASNVGDLSALLADVDAAITTALADGDIEASVPATAAVAAIGTAATTLYDALAITNAAATGSDVIVLIDTTNSPTVNDIANAFANLLAQIRASNTFAAA